MGGEINPRKGFGILLIDKLRQIGQTFTELLVIGLRRVNFLTSEKWKYFRKHIIINFIFEF